MDSIVPSASAVDISETNTAALPTQFGKQQFPNHENAPAVDNHLQRSVQHWELRYLWQNMRTALPLFVCDQLVLWSTLALVFWCFELASPSYFVGISGIYVALGCSLAVAFVLGGLYPAVGVPPGVEVQKCVVSILLVFLVFLTAKTLYEPSSGSTIAVVVAGIICLVAVPLCRHLTRKICARFRWWMQPVVIFGYGSACSSLVKTLQASPYLGLSPIGVLDDPNMQWKSESPIRYLGPSESAAAIRERLGVYRAIVAMPDRPISSVHKVLSSSSDCFPHFLVLQKKQGLPLLWTSGWDYGWHSGVQVQSKLLLPIPRLTKRLFDLMVVILAIPLLVPLFLLIATAIKCSAPGPLFFGQERIGRGGRLFRAWKFRTMVHDAEKLLSDYLSRHPELRAEWEANHKLADDPRVVTWIGRFLRKSSLDELPQLWNVLIGEMSLVGPRPLPEYHLANFDEKFRRYREKIAPGMTGLWQVNGRSDGDPKMWVKWDTYYVRNWSLWLDLQILFSTPKAVVRGNGL